METNQFFYGNGNDPLKNPGVERPASPVQQGHQIYRAHQIHPCVHQRQCFGRERANLVHVRFATQFLEPLEGGTCPLISRLRSSSGAPRAASGETKRHILSQACAQLTRRCRKDSRAG